MSLTAQELQAAGRLTAGYPSGYNNQPGDPSANPYGMAGAIRNYTVNLYALSADLVLLGQAAVRESGDAAASAASAIAKAAEATTAANSAAANAATMIAKNVSGAIAIGTGTKTLTGAVLAGKNFFKGQQLKYADVAAPSTKWMRGAVTAYTDNGGSSSVSIDVQAGGFAGTSPSGTWDIGPIGDPGPTGNGVPMITTGDSLKLPRVKTDESGYELVSRAGLDRPERKTASFTAFDGGTYVVKPGVAALDITPDASLPDGGWFKIGIRGDATKVTLLRGARTIRGAAENLTFSSEPPVFLTVYNDNGDLLLF
jgi:hypothetical protein